MIAASLFSAAVLGGILLFVGFTDGAIYPLLILAAAFVHESGHLAAAFFCRVPLRSFTVHPAGLSLRYDTAAVSYGREIAVILAGPLAGLTSAAAVLCICDLQREGPFFFFSASLVMSLFNLLPAAPLDGGALLSALLSWGGRADLAPLVLRAATAVSAVFVFATALLVQMFLGGNLSLFAVSVWLLYRLQNAS